MESKINVSVRIKPLSEVERAQDKNHIWTQISDNTIANVKTKENFGFDQVFGEKIHTQEIFDSQIKDLVNTAMSGINVTVFAYGQTSSGKTYTMRGYSNKDPGLIPLSIHQVFDQINQDKERTYTISVSYLEIYNESLNDLIETQNKNLEIRESISKGIYINRLAECAVTTKEEVLKYMWQGDESRIIAETKLNEQSSRSHTVFRINVTSKQNDDETKIRMSQLNLVDLAGSEGASRTQTDGLRLREGSNINRSLLALSNVINRLSSASGGKTFINFRDSKLTRILQTSLGGNSKTAIICTMTQTLSNYQETLNTLHFGMKAKNVKTTVNVNEINNGLFNGQLGPEMEKANKEISELKNKLKEYEMKMMEFQTSIDSSSIEVKSSEDVQMIDTSLINGEQKSSIGRNSTGGKDSDFTVNFLREQLKFVNDRLKRSTEELEQKENLIQKLDHEKREFLRQNESLEIENIKLAEKIKDLMQNQLPQKQDGSCRKKKKNQSSYKESDSFRTPNINKHQNKRVLEQDGIKCFDLERQSLNPDTVMEQEEVDLRQSIGLSRKSLNHSYISQNVQIMQHSQDNINQQPSALEIEDQLFMIEELEILKKENEEMQVLIEKANLEKINVQNQVENNFAMREEVEILKEESLFQGEELVKYQRHCNSLADENNDLLRRLDDCERTLLSSSDNENNSSVIIIHETQKETQKLLKDENQALKTTIQKLKEEFKQLEMERSRSESIRAEIEYTNRAAEYNVEILKNQIDNLNNENAMMKKQEYKQKKSIEIMRSTNERMSQDLEYYKKLSLNHQQRKSNQGGAALPKNMQGQTPLKPNMESTPVHREIEGRHSIPPAQEFIIAASLADCSMENIAQDQITLPKRQFSHNESQVTLLDPQVVAIKDSQIIALQNECDEKQKKIDELEKQLQSLQTLIKAPVNESEAMKKLKFDFQILMHKLSEYKKAEKNAKEIVNDYDQMKMKYFTILTEKSNQQTHIQEIIQSRLDNEIQLKELNEEKEQYINELYMLRMDITKKIDEINKKTAQNTHLQEELSLAYKKVSETLKKDNEIAGLQTEIDNFAVIFCQVDKHLRTLVKLLREFISRCGDPKLIEHNQKQVKSIEGLLEEVKDSIKGRDILSSGDAGLIESFFVLSNDSLRDMQTSAITEAETSTAKITGLIAETAQKKNLKRRKINEQGDFIFIEDDKNKQSYESAGEEGTIIAKKNASMSVKQKKMMMTVEKKAIEFEHNATPSRRSDRKVKKE